MLVLLEIHSKTFKMEATVENNWIKPDSAIEIEIESNTNDSGNDNEVIILNKSDSVKSDDDIVLIPMQTSIEETGKVENSPG